MGMMIDKAQSNLRNIQRYYIKADNETIDFAIDILRKYQKIKEIIADWKSDGGAFEMSEPYWLRKIKEIVEDGNDR